MEFIKRTRWALFIFFILPIIGVLITKGLTFHFDVNIDSEFWRSIIISISTSLFATGIVYIFIDKKLHELKALDDEITIILKSPGGHKISCPPMSRKDFSRAEVMGYIGSTVGKTKFDMNPHRFKEMASQIRQIQKTKDNIELVIDCTEEELKQFTSGHQENDDITVVLQSDSDPSNKVTCPPMPRKNFSRAEVLGYIGMFSNVQHFAIKKLKSPQFLKDLSDISKSKGAQEFIIECTDDELKQFKEPA
ncbi:hypothetical protein MSP8887_02451 [Marinomonas spartinae]|nr:hypothetical protein MSP8887_02451 [Marinomonas spartinae]